MGMPEVAVIDLFAGAGGLSLGAHLAGAETRLAIELDPICCHTLRNNLGAERVLEGDVEALTATAMRRKAKLSSTDILLVVGGAPCQPFSKASYWTDSGADSRYRRARANGRSAPKPKPITSAKPDQRRSLIFEFERIVRESKANGFVFENVPSILHPRSRNEFDEFRRRLEVSGYRTTLVIANATDFGVAQKRQRVFLLGAKSVHPREPESTHSSEAIDGKQPIATAGQVLKPFASKRFFEPREVVSGRWAAHLQEVPPGWNYKALTAWAGHPTPTFEAETRFWNFLLKLSPTAPSWTLAANPGPWTGPFHWDSRRLRTVEMAALQTFPIGYEFEGSVRERVRQIGNAVPPLMAKAMILSVSDAVRNECQKRRNTNVKKERSAR
jgi:DNA (cytosine-5)-methyltransferase 1